MQIYHALMLLLHFPWLEMLYEEQNIQWKHYINVLKLIKIYNAT